MTKYEYFSLLLAEGKLVYDDGFLVRRWNRKSGWLPIPQRIGVDGPPKVYVQVSARIDGKLIVASAHRVIWRHLKGEIPPGMEVNHIDGNKRNNRIENLELVTPSENLFHAHAIGLVAQPRGSGHHMAKLTESQVAEIRRDGSRSNLAPMAEKFGVSRASISLILSGKTWQHVRAS